MAALGEFSQFVPDISFSGMGLMFSIIGIIILICVVTSLVAWFIIVRKKYCKKVLLFRKVGQQIVPILKEKGCFERIGLAGDYWLYCKKSRKVLPRPRIQMGKNEFWYYEREDGEWINFSLQDFDKIMKTAGVYYVDEDMRLQRLGIEKNLKDRLLKKSFWEKYGTTIMWVMFVVVVTVCLVILFKELSGTVGAIGTMSNQVSKMADAVNNMATRVGSGTIPA